MIMASAVDRGRASFDRQRWSEARELLSAADREVPLAPEDLERLAMSAYMLGDDAASIDLWTRAHHEFTNRGDIEHAAGCAARIAIDLLFKGKVAPGSGWLARARRLLDDAGRDSAVRGYLLIPDGVRELRSGNAARGYEIFSEAVAIGQRFGEADLITLARQAQGRALIKMGKVDAGVALLDEAMIAVMAGELSAMTIGIVYCSTIDACHEIFDLKRAQEWTNALTRWCERQPDLVPYRGACLVHRAELLQLRGAWTDAMGEVVRACDRVSVPPPDPGVGRAHYRRGELHRLRGELTEAEAAYRQASEWGRRPQPGLALLRLAQGDVAAALASIRRVVGETRTASEHADVLGACVEIQLAAGDAAGARVAATELRDIAAESEAPFLRGMAAHAMAAVLLAEGNDEEALVVLRHACEAWTEVEAPYENARTCVLIALASRALGDDDTSELELEAARRTFERLGAAPDLARVNDLARSQDPKAPGPLTPREREVLELVASGRTNRAIATALGLSEKTVARHVANIFTKLGLSTRAAATAYAYRNGLVGNG